MQLITFKRHIKATPYYLNMSLLLKIQIGRGIFENLQPLMKTHASLLIWGSSEYAAALS